MFDIENLYKFITSVGTLLAGIGAILAAYTWRKQIKYKKRYEAAENLEKCFLDYCDNFYKHYYGCIRELRKNKQATAVIELYPDVPSIISDKYRDFSFAWRKMETSLDKKEIEKFTYTANYIQQKFIGTIPSKTTDLDKDGNYTLSDNAEWIFEEKIDNLRKDGLSQIKKIYGKKLFNF